MSWKYNVQKTFLTRRFPAAIPIPWVHASSFFIQFYFYCRFFCCTFFPVCRFTMSDFFFDTILHQWMCAVIRKNHAIQIFRGKLFSFGFFFFSSLAIVAAVSAVLLLARGSFASAVIACISISLVGNHALCCSLSLHMRRNISICCRFTVRLVLFHVNAAVLHPRNWCGLSLPPQKWH